MNEGIEEILVRAVLMNRAEYSAYRGWSSKQTTDYIKKGVIRLVGKMVDREQADNAIKFYADPVEGAHLLPKEKGPESEEGALSYSEARRRKEIARAKLNELDVQEREGILVIQDDEREKGYAAAQKVKDALFSIADRLPPLLAVEKKETKIRELLMKEFTAICEELANSN